MLQCLWAFVLSFCYFWLILTKNVWGQQVSGNSTTNNTAQKSKQHLKLVWLTGTETLYVQVRIFATFCQTCTKDCFMKHVLTNEYLFGFEPFKSQWYWNLPPALTLQHYPFHIVYWQVSQITCTACLHITAYTFHTVFG